MSCESYHWHYDYPRLAWDSGFCFNGRQSKDVLNRNEIGVVDIERIIKERDVSTVDRYLPTVIECKLDEEQLQILEPTFAKLFRLSQLSVEYLVYCKQYLDNTVVVLKKELYSLNGSNVKLKNQIQQRDSENVRLRKKIRDMKDTLNLHQNALSLNPESHKIRNSLEEKFLLETDKLQLEIKELKEKLNRTERFYKENSSPEHKPCERHINTEEPYKVIDLQNQFELLKEHVSNELKHLQSQKKYDAEKLEEWGQFITQKITECANKNVHMKDIESNRARRNSQTQTEEETSKVQKHFSDAATNPIEIKSSANPIDVLSESSTSEMKSRHNKSNNDTQLFYSIAKKVQEDLQHQNESNFDKLEEVLEKKVSNTMETFQGKMEKFWVKLDELEKKQSHKMEEISKQVQDTNAKQNPPNYLTVSKPLQRSNEKDPSRKIAIQQPQIVFQKKQFLDSESESEESEYEAKQEPKKLKQPRIQLRSIKPVPLAPNIKVKSGDNNKKLVQSESASSSSSETSASESESESDSFDEDSAVSEELPKQKTQLREDIQHLMDSRLKNLGLSPDWKGIPNKSYKTTHDIIEHQKNINAKKFDSYRSIQKNILRSLDEKVRAFNKERKKGKRAIDPVKPTKKSASDAKSNKPVAAPRTNLSTVEKRQPKPAPKPKLIVPRLKLENLDVSMTQDEDVETNVPIPIKTNPKTPKKMYVTDSESDNGDRIVRLKSGNSDKENQNKIETRTLPIEIIKELQQKQQIFTAKPQVRSNKAEGDDRFRLDSDISDQKDLKQKSNLKNYPSFNSLAKKKVLFDVSTNENSSVQDNKTKNKQLVPVKSVDNGSTSSIDSTVLDGSKTNLLEVPSTNQDQSKKKSHSDEENLDWDISDILC